MTTPGERRATRSFGPSSRDTGSGYCHGHQLHKHALEKEDIVFQDGKQIFQRIVTHHLEQQVCKNLSLPGWWSRRPTA